MSLAGRKRSGEGGTALAELEAFLQDPTDSLRPVPQAQHVFSEHDQSFEVIKMITDSSF